MTRGMPGIPHCRRAAYDWSMTTVTTIPADCLGGLDVRQGDTLRILVSRGNELVVEIHRDTPGQPRGSGSISQWLRSAKGSVRLKPGESVGDVRMDYYSAKYGLDG
jgi:hypothetical protein